MTERLKTICSLVGRTGSFIDVGCDHGYAVRYVWQHALADKITACDISAPSLAKARALLGEDSGVNFVCGDGAQAAQGYDTVLVSGLGGLEICSVIEHCEPEVFILSPHSHAYEVRKMLAAKDYRIVYDRVIRDGKFYDVIKAERGGADVPDEIRCRYGTFALTEKNDALVCKLGSELAARQKYPAREDNLHRIKEIEEVLEWQQR